MSYIVVVNPAILSTAGIPAGPSFVATVLVAAFGCYFMAFYANRPFAIAPYMGENAFIAFTVCKLLGFRWQTALASFVATVLVAAFGCYFMAFYANRPFAIAPYMGDWRKTP